MRIKNMPRNGTYRMLCTESGTLAGDFTTAAAKMADEFDKIATCVFVTNGSLTADPAAAQRTIRIL